MKQASQNEITGGTGLCSSMRLYHRWGCLVVDGWVPGESTYWLR